MSFFHPGRPKDPPPLSIEEQAKAAHLKHLFDNSNTPLYRRQVAEGRCFFRMLDLVEGRATPNGSKE